MNNLPYKSYKNSGIEWIGDLPVDWGVSKIKYLGNLYTGNSLNDAEKSLYESEDESHIPYISSKDIDLNTRAVNYKNGLRIPPDSLVFKKAPKGSFLICIEGGSAGKKIARLNQDVNFVNKLCCIDAKDADYLYYFFQSLNFSDKFNLSMTGLIGGVSTSALKNFEIPTPSQDEQIKICNFLDRETAKIDELIQRQQRLIELIEEERKAIIDQTISRGLNKERELKNSGLTWLGKIPKHWNVKPLKYLISFNDDVLPESTADDYEINYVEVGDVSERVGIASSTEIAFKDAASRARRLVKHGDILISTVRTYLRAIAPVINPSSNMVVSTGFAVIRPKNLNNDYARFLLSTEYFLSEVISRSTGVSYPAINASDLVQIKVPVPPIEEQEEIAEFIQSKCKTMDLLVSKSENSIKFLKEHRASLISAAVTGKIDVRELT